jgi:hypothetical protein
MDARKVLGAVRLEIKMPKKSAEAFTMSENMWGKPLASSVRQATDDKKKKVTRMQTEDDDAVDSDVDDELEDGDDTEEVTVTDEDDDELVAEEAVAESDESGDDDADEEFDEEDEESDSDDDTVAETENEVAATVDDDEEDAPATTGAKNRKVVMSEKKSGADHIRDEIEKRKRAGDSMRGVDIVAALAKRKIEVSPAQVSQLLKKAGLGGAPRGKKVAAGVEEKSRIAGKAKRQPAAAPPRATPKRPVVTGGKSTTLPMAQLTAAGAFLAACNGCYETAEEILSTHKQLGSVYAVSR